MKDRLQASGFRHRGLRDVQLVLGPLPRRAAHAPYSPTPGVSRKLKPETCSLSTEGRYMGQVVNREEAWDLMCEWTESDSLRKHMLAVEAAMRAYARSFGEDEEKWGVTGLLHDMDYEKHPTPDEHPMVGVRELEKTGLSRGRAPRHKGPR